MNLLIDPWIPVQQEGKQRLICLQDVLCRDEPWRISLPRDDMEMACLQLMICLTQVVFRPVDDKALRQHIRTAMQEEDYQKGITPYQDWFDVHHPDTPFMQTRSVKSVKPTPIQKLFVGLPEGNNHCFFNDAGELHTVSASAAVIALFNQAMNAPSMGGGFKGGFRGGAPVTSLIYGENLRQMIWFNVLHEDSLRLLMPAYDATKAHDVPTWVEPIKAGSSIPASSIGLLRGLFWQPAHIELITNSAGVCQFYGSMEESLVTAFNKEKFVYNIIGQWIHPHSPRYWQLKKGEREEKYVSFTTTAPAWTHLTRFVVAQESEKEGQQPAANAQQWQKLTRGKALTMVVGGYRNKQASILQRRHELISLASGWEDHHQMLSGLIEAAIQIKSALRGKLYGFAKTSGASAVPDQAEALFYQNSEPLIHACLRSVDWQQAIQIKKELIQQLMQISWDIFHQVTKPYQHEPKMILAIAVATRTLTKEFKKIQGVTP